MATEATPRFFTVDEYHRMGEAGVLQPDDRLELLDGRIMMMSPIGRRHAACVDRMNHFLNKLLGDSAIVRVQNPVVLDTHTELQPDVALLRPRDDFYSNQHPTPADVLLIIEVAESSLRYDRQEKLPVYAKAGIAEVWIIDLAQNVVHTFCDPQAAGYARVAVASRGLELQIRTLHVALRVDDLIG